MKVYFRGQLRYLGCYYYRCLLPLQYNGFDGDKLTMRDLKKPEEASRAIQSADVVVMHRPFEKQSKDLLLALKQMGKKIVFDNDDSYKVQENPENDVTKLGEYWEAVSNSINWFVKNSDMVTTTTLFLAKEYEKLNPNVVVLPNYINPDDFPKRQVNRSKKVRIGVIGSVAETSDFEPIKGLLTELSKRDDVQLVLFSLNSTQLDKYPYWKEMNVEWQPYVHIYDYFQTLANLKLDIVLIPRLNSYFNRCKSNVKFLECSMLEIPVIAQTWNDGESPYDLDGEYMMLANKEDEWRTKVNELIQDKELRRMIGKRAKKYVLKNYDIRKNASRWKTAYDLLLNPVQ